MKRQFPLSLQYHRSTVIGIAGILLLTGSGFGLAALGGETETEDEPDPRELLNEAPLATASLLETTDDMHRRHRPQPPLTSADIFCFANRPLDFCHRIDWLETRLTGDRPSERANLDFRQLAAFLDLNITNESMVARLKESDRAKWPLDAEVRGVFFTRDGTGHHYALGGEHWLRVTSNDPYVTEGEFMVAEPVRLIIRTPRMSDLYKPVWYPRPGTDSLVARLEPAKGVVAPPTVPLAVPAKEDVLFFANGPYDLLSRTRERMPKEYILKFLGEWSESRVLSREESVALWRKRSGSKWKLPPIQRDGALATKEKKVIFWQLLAADMLFLEDEAGASCLLLKGTGDRPPDTSPGADDLGTSSTNRPPQPNTDTRSKASR